MKFWYLLVAARGAHPEHEQTHWEGAGGSAPTSPPSFPSAGKLGSSQHPHGPNACTRSQGLQVLGCWDAPAAGCSPRASHAPSLQEGSSKAGTGSSSPSECQGHGKQKHCKSKGEKSKAIFGGRICLPVPVNLKCEAKTKAAGITLQRNGL